LQYPAAYWYPIATSRYAYASFWRRAVAYVLDSIMLMVVIVLVELILHATTGIQLYDKRSSPNGFSISFRGPPVYVPMLIYFIWMNGRGATLGKMMLGIRVTNRDGGVPGIRRGALRSIVLIIAVGIQDFFALLADILGGIGGWDWAFVTAGVGLGLGLLFGFLQLADWLSMIWHPNKQTFHDQIGGTYVIRG
jgi:uncharacterized RDD family membrane protein YckC